MVVKQLGVIYEPNFIPLTEIDWIGCPESQAESERARFGALELDC